MKKIEKTTLFAVFGLILLLVLTTLLILGKMDGSTYGIALGACATFISSMIGIVAADRPKKETEEDLS